MNKTAIVGALALAAALAGCQQSGVTASDAQSLSTAFCSTWLPAAGAVVGNLNKQLQADYATATAACAAIGNGGSVNAVTVAVAALELYEGVTATYPKFTALSDRDLATARRLIDTTGLR